MPHMKDHIPVRVKLRVWTSQYGESTSGGCFICHSNLGMPKILCKQLKKKESQYKSGEFGHILAENNGGKASVENLKVICKSCNVRMATKHLHKFSKEASQNMVTEESIELMDIQTLGKTIIDPLKCRFIKKNGMQCKVHAKFFCHIHRDPNITIAN